MNYSLRNQKSFLFWSKACRADRSQWRFSGSLAKSQNPTKLTHRHEIMKYQNDIFAIHKSDIMKIKVPRIEKIEVHYKGRNIRDDALMLMNKSLSTPHQCAMHVSKNLSDDSVLALVKSRNAPENEDGKIVKIENEEPTESSSENMPSTEIITVADGPNWVPWDMHRPLEEDCELKLLNFHMNLANEWESRAVNKAYWKSCAVVLGAIAQEAFEDEVPIKLAHLPNIPEKAGAFCYDIELSKSLLNSDGSSKWKVDESVLIALTKSARHLISQNLKFERLELHKSDAAEIFKHNEHHLRRIEENSFLTVPSDYVPIYKFGKYLDICDGPLMPSTATMYHFVVTAVHQLRCSKPERIGTCLWRFQGLSLPKRLQVHHAIWAMLEHRARNLVKKDLPFSIMESTTHDYDVTLREYRSIENETKKYNEATGQWSQDGWWASDEKLNVPTT